MNIDELGVDRLVKEHKALIRTISAKYGFDVNLLSRNMFLEAYTDTYERLVLVLHRRILAGDTITEIKNVSYPRDWWQHFKQRWAPKWILKRWPVQMAIDAIPVTVTRMCPHVDIPTNLEHYQWLNAYIGQPQQLRYKS